MHLFTKLFHKHFSPLIGIITALFIAITVYIRWDAYATECGSYDVHERIMDHMRKVKVIMQLRACKMLNKGVRQQ